MKKQRKDHVSTKDFLYRHQAQNEHLVDLAVVSGQWCTPTPRCADSAAYWLRSRRHDGVLRPVSGEEILPRYVVFSLYLHLISPPNGLQEMLPNRA